MDKINESSNVMHNFKGNSTSSFSSKLIGIFVIIAVLGIISGYILAQINPKGGSAISVGKDGKVSNVEKGKTYGSNNTKAFPDNATGILKEGGIDGEGEYHLERAGGPSQYVYLTSSTVDLSQFINRKIKVWGETQKAQKAGWLMDAGRVQVLE